MAASWGNARRSWGIISLFLTLGAGLWALPAGANEPLMSLTSGQPLIGENFKLGRDVYKASCAGCHDVGVNRAPQATVLRNLRPDAIYKALDQGVMKPMATGLTETEKVAVSEFLAERRFDRSENTGGIQACEGEFAAFDLAKPPKFAGWGLDHQNSHAVSAQAAGINGDNVGTLKLRWAFGFANSNRIRSQPALAGGAIFIGSQNSYVHVLDRQTGCERWRFEAAAEVRTTIVIEPWTAGDSKADPLAFFGDQVGNVYAVKALSGNLVWKARMDTHPAAVITATPVLHDGILYVPVSSLEEAAAGDSGYPCCSFRGSVVAVDAATGKEKWRTYMVGEPQKVSANDERQSFGPSGVAVWSTPALDPGSGLMFVATGDNYSDPATELSDAVLALDMETGAIVWSQQATKGDVWNVACYFNGPNCPEDEGPDFDFGAATILARTAEGRQLVLAGQKSGIAYAFDAATGTPVWQTRLGRGGLAGGVLFGMAASNNTLFVPISDFGEHEFTGFPPSPGLYALDISSGKLRWAMPAPDVCPADLQFCYPGTSSAISATPDLVFAGAEDGHFRIFDAATGKILRDLDLLRKFETVNGVAATGGAMSGGGAPIADAGQLIIASGYGHAMKMAGNVLLVYEVEQ